jgi:hypothetical protein
MTRPLVAGHIARSAAEIAGSGLAFAADFLEVHQFRQALVLEDVMTSADACQTKAEALHKVAKVSKAEVLKVTIEKAT